MEAKKIETIDKYFLKDKHREAIIIFRNGIFYKCDFNFSGVYDLIQWRFLRDTANEIERIDLTYDNSN